MCVLERLNVYLNNNSMSNMIFNIGLLLHLFKSGIRGSNSRLSAWEADTLPAELIPHNLDFVGVIMLLLLL